MHTVSIFKEGFRDGIPICMGYFAVALALGITAGKVGFDGLQGFIMSAGMLASAGEYAAVELIRTGAGVLEIIMTCLIVNMRYILMGCALTQKLGEDTSPVHRFGLAYCITDEIFALSSLVRGKLNPFYTYGITLISALGWAFGTLCGIVLGNVLPQWIVNALSVSLYGMFLAVIIPPSRKNMFIGGLVAVSMLMSLLFTRLPLLSNVSSGFRIIILTLVLASGAALIRPLEET